LCENLWIVWVPVRMTGWGVGGADGPEGEALKSATKGTEGRGGGGAVRIVEDRAALS